MHDAFVYIPYALLFLESALKSAHHQVKVVDFQLGRPAEKTFKDALEEHPDVLGISVFCGPSIELAKKAAAVCRRISPKTVIVWGGMVPSMYPEWILADPNCDYVVRFEGEETFVRLVEALGKGDRHPPIPNVGWKDGDAITLQPRAPLLDLGDTKPIDFKSVAREEYVIKLRLFDCNRAATFFSSRGCPYACTFCYNQYYHDGKWRSFPTEWIVETIGKLVDTYRIDGLYFFDDNFFVSKSRVKEIMEGLKGKGIRLTWWAEIRIDQIAKLSVEELNEFYGYGLRQLYIGAESGSDERLERLKKGFAIEVTRKANDLLAKTKIEAMYSFMIGFPGETTAETMKTLDFAMELIDSNPMASIHHINNFVPFPKTPIYEEAMATRGAFLPASDAPPVGGLDDPEQFVFSDTSNRTRQYISYASWFLRNDEFLRNKPFLYRIIFRTFRAAFTFRMRRHIFVPFIDTLLMTMLYNMHRAFVRGKSRWSIQLD